ncbi:MAG: energy transducer TonB [Terriglobales bacterium]
MLAHRLLTSVVVLASSMLCSGFADAKESPEDKSKPLIEAAAKRSLFHTDVNHPFSVTLAVAIHVAKGGILSGNYIWIMNPGGDWYRETSFSNYKDVQRGRGQNIWTKRSVDFMPLQEVLIEKAFSQHIYLDHIDVPVKRYFSTSHHHVTLQCIEWKNANTLCFDSEGNLRKSELSDFRITYDYSDYRPAGVKYAPYKIVATRDGQMLLEANIESLSTQNDQVLPEPGPDAFQRPGCLMPSQPKAKQKVAPQYPTGAREQHQQGHVIVAVRIGTDGMVRNPVVIQTAGKDLDFASLAAIKQWSFEPAKCGDLPVEFEDAMQVNFEIR